MSKTYYFEEATEDQLHRLLAILDCIDGWQLENLMKWAAEGGEYFFGNDTAVESLEAGVESLRELGLCQ